MRERLKPTHPQNPRENYRAEPIDKAACERRALELVAKHRLTATQFLVLAFVAHNSDEAGRLIMLTQQIAHGVGLARRTVKSALTALVDTKLIKRRPRFDSRRKNSKLASSYSLGPTPWGTTRPGTFPSGRTAPSAVASAPVPSDDTTPDSKYPRPPRLSNLSAHEVPSAKADFRIDSDGRVIPLEPHSTREKNR